MNKEKFSKNEIISYGIFYIFLTILVTIILSPIILGIVLLFNGFPLFVCIIISIILSIPIVIVLRAFTR